MTLPRIPYSRLRFYHFVDVDDQELGTLEDVILDPHSLTPTHIVLGGGFFEEFMESKGEIDDIDEIASLDLVDRIDNDFIVLKTKLEDLETTDSHGNLPIEGYKYTDFLKYPLSDRNGAIDGEIVDFVFDENDSLIIVHYPEVEQKMKLEGYMQKFEFHVPIDKVSVTDKIVEIDIDREMLFELIKEQVEIRMNGKSAVLLPK